MYLKKWMVAATLLLAVGGYAQNSKLVLNKGQKYEVTSVTKTNSLANVMGQEMENITNTTTVELIEVKNTSDKQTDLVTTLTRMVMNASAMGQEINFDSDKKDNSGPGAEDMSKEINKPKNVSIDANGKLIGAEKAEADAMDMMKAGGAQSGISLFREGLIGKSMKVGDSWLDSVIVHTEKIKTNTSGMYTVKTIENNIATIIFAGTSTLKGVMEQMGQEMDMISTSKVTAETKLDITNGVILESATNTDGNMTIMAAGMEIPVTVKASVTTKTKML